MCIFKVNMAPTETDFVKDLLLRLLLLLTFLPPPSCQAQDAPEKYLGSAGNMYISEREFLERFEMLPALHRHIKPKLMEAKLELMYSLIAEKLLAQEAESRKLDQDSVFKGALLHLRKLLARDELYREEVSQKVSLSAEEIAAGTSMAQVELRVSYIFFPRREDADFVRERIHTPRDFEAIRIDSSMDHLRDTVTIVWGEADPPIERAAYALRKGAVSPVVEAGQGFYILRLDHRQLGGPYASMQPEVLRDRVVKQLRIVKEREAILRIVPDLLSGKPGYAKPGPFELLSKALVKVFREHGGDSLTFVDAGMVDQITEECHESLDDTFAVAGSQVWSVRDMIQMLYSKQFRASRARAHAIPFLLNANVSDWVQQELLGQVALDRRLDTVPAVQKQMEMWTQSYLAAEMKEYVHQHTTLSDAEVWSYLKSKEKDIPVPTVQLRELRTRTVDEMGQALADLERGKPFPDVIRKWSVDPEARETEGLLPAFPVTERPPLGAIAMQMDVGQRYGPIQTHNGEVYFELVAKHERPLQEDTSLAGKFARGSKELRRMKERRALDLVLSKAGKLRGYTIYSDRLEKLEVTPIPMMTYRILGFGGRIFAVPFVDPLIDWMGIEPPERDLFP